MRVSTTCAYCGVGCGVEVSHVAAAEPQIAGSAEHPANFGRLCSKGAALGETLGLEGRLLQPIVDGRRATWDAALDAVAERFRRIIGEHGPDAVGFYVSGQLLTEDYYVANKLMKGFLGSANIDTNSRLCMASTVAGHRRAFGADVVPGCYEDWDGADLVVLVGANAAWCHPVLFQRLLAARERRGTRIIVIDPRRTATADEADLHLALQPGSDVRLFNGLLTHLATSAALDREFVAAHTEGFDAAVAAARAGGDVDAVARGCGLQPAAVSEFFAAFASTPRTVTAFSQGVHQSTSGTDKVNAILNCHLATGRIGRPGCGPFSLTGQPNAMGGREVGGLATTLAAHMPFDDANCDRVQRFWRSPTIARRPGLTAVDLFRAMHEGSVRAVWIQATNPAASLPDADAVAAALRRCELVVVSDCYAATDTARFAHILLPATTWGEKDGTVTNSERRISRQRAFRPAPGVARPDWWITTEVARRLGFAEAFPYSRPAEIFREHAALSRFENQGERAFDLGPLAELSDAQYESMAPVTWPLDVEFPNGRARMFGDGRFCTANRRARFVALRPAPPAHPVDAHFPLVLNTGRLRDQWHTMTRSGRSARLSQHAREPQVEIHPVDAARAGVAPGSLARVATRWGTGLFRVEVSDRQRSGMIFVPMHWAREHAAQSLAASLVNPACDPHSAQPELKHTPARIDAVSPAWRGFLLSRDPVPPPACSYWVRTTVDGGYRYELAGIGSDPSALAALAWDAAAPHADALEFVDASRGSRRVARFDEGRLLQCWMTTVHGELPPRDWLVSLLGEGSLLASERASLLAGRRADLREAADDVVVCACFRVGRQAIVRTIAERGISTVEGVGAALAAGTNCGSCRPEIGALLRSARAECVA